jgi:hypothetical protein
MRPVVGGDDADPSEGEVHAQAKDLGGFTRPSIGLTMFGSVDQGAMCADGSCAVPDALAAG